jgi:LuxR family maltose regulon positive regulatory protein
MAAPVLASKMFLPARRPQLVARPRLTAYLDRALDAGQRLTIVSAPAGFGKTTVLSDWLTHVGQDRLDTRFAWLSLDEHDNNLSRFVTHMLASLRSVDLDLEASGVESLHGTVTSDVLTDLVNDVVRAGEDSPGQQWVLVLDDYHLIEAPDVQEAMLFLLDHLPACLRLVVATRSDPPFPLARLRSRGQLTEVRAAELRFTASEAQEFLNRQMGLTLSRADVEALEDRTEGWIAGLQLAALSIRDIPEPEEVAGFIEAFTGSNRFVIDYLVDEVLARQPAHVRDFLLRSAVLDRLTGSLCDAVTGTVDGAKMLQELESSNLFLIPLDVERSWYRYHHLFADVLRARLAAEQPDGIKGLHERATTWFASHGFDEDAVRHALATADFDRAALLMEEALPELRRSRQDGVLLGWVGSLPEAVTRRSPVLSILSGWSLMMSGDLDAAGRRFDEAEAALARGAHDEEFAARWADTDDLRTAPAMVSVYRASLAQARGDIATTVRHAQRAVILPDPRTISCAAPDQASSVWPLGRPAMLTRHCRHSPRRSAACMLLETLSTNWTAQSCSPTSAWLREDRVAPGGCANRHCSPPPRISTRTSEPPPTFTLP